MKLEDYLYYQDTAGEIYCGDCLEILPLLEPNSVDLVLTDPPYGVGIKYGKYDDTEQNWFNVISNILPLLQSISTMILIQACQIKRLGWLYEKFPPDWLIAWHKGSPGTQSYIGFNDWEPILVYGKKKGLCMHDYFSVNAESFLNGHPCPKPIRWGLWLISRASNNNDIILDPFLGSGTTAVAAKQLGRRFIGIEIEEKYCEIAKQRLAQEMLL